MLHAFLTEAFNINFDIFSWRYDLRLQMKTEKKY